MITTYVGNGSEPAVLAIVMPLPTISIGETLQERREFFGVEAEKIERLLNGHLPGGIYDALLGAMLHRKATIFNVAHNDKA